MSTRGQRLVDAMKMRGMPKQFALAYSIGVNESTVTRWKNDGPMSIGNAILICKYLDVSMDWFLTGEGRSDQHKSAFSTQKDADDTLLISLHRLTQPMTDTSKALLSRFIDSVMEA